MMKQKVHHDLIKIKYKFKQQTKNKVLNCKNLGYLQLAQKLTNNLGIEKSKYYRLYYINEQQEQIIVNTQEDYEIFIQTTENLILHLQETLDQQIHFYKVQQQAVQSQNIQQLREALKNKQKQVSALQKKKQQFKNYTEIIEKKRKEILEQLQNFKNELQKKTIKSLQEGLAKINQKCRLSAGTFEHKASCQNKACTNDRKIVGIKYKCLECSLDFCSQCAEEQLRSFNLKHEPKHPMLKVRDDQWEQLETRIQKQFCQSGLKQKIAQLSDLTFCSQEQASRFVYKYPHLDSQQLIDKALNNPSELKNI